MHQKIRYCCRWTLVFYGIGLALFGQGKFLAIAEKSDASSPIKKNKSKSKNITISAKEANVKEKITIDIPKPKPLFDPQISTLDNGLKVVVVTNTLSPTIAVGVLYNYGASDDPVEQIGIAHFLEHLMFKGTKKYPSGYFDKTILRLGGQTNAWTSNDATFYHTQIAKQHLETILELEADRMVNLDFSPEEVISEQGVVKQERLMRLENHPFGCAYEAQMKSIFWYHPYQYPTIGYPHHIDNYDYDSVRKMYSTWYAPNNATVIVVGDTTLKEVEPIVRKHFSSLESKKIPNRQRPQEPHHQGITNYVRQKNKRNSLAMWEWVYAAPNHNKGSKQHYYPLQILADLIGGGQTRPLYKKLVEEKKLALSFSCDYYHQTLDPYYFSFSITLAPGADENEVKEIIKKYIDDLINHGVDELEFLKAKRDLIFSASFSRDGNNTSLESFTDLAIGLSHEEIDGWAIKINDVTKKQVEEAAKEVLGQKPVCIVELYPDSRETDK